MSGPKILLLVLFLIALLYVVAINLGAAHPDDQSFQKPAWLTGIGDLLVKPRTLQFSDLTASPTTCFQKGEIVILVDTTCTFAIQQSSFTQRIVSLHLIQGTSVTLTLSNQEEILPVIQSLTTGATTNADLKVYPGKTHGILSIHCLNAAGTSPCILTPK